MSTRPEPSRAAGPAAARGRPGPAVGAAPAIALRPASPADDEFCWRLHKAAMGGYITLTWGWDEQKQRRSQARSFNPGRWLIITVDGADAGMLDVVREPGQIYLGRIEILPHFQGQGIGTRLIGELIDEAAQQGQDFPGRPPIALRLLATDKSLLIEAWDQSPLDLEPREADPGDECGRGLTVVAALSDLWGWERTGDRRKVVWAEIARGQFGGHSSRSGG